MAARTDVRAVRPDLPDTHEDPEPTWRVHGRPFAFRRPLRRADLAHLGPLAPDDAPMGAWVPGCPTSPTMDALLRSEPDLFLTTPHVDGYPVVLVRLDVIARDELREVVLDARLTRAPRPLAERRLADG